MKGDSNDRGITASLLPLERWARCGRGRVDADTLPMTWARRQEWTKVVRFLDKGGAIFSAAEMTAGKWAGRKDSREDPARCTRIQYELHVLAVRGDCPSDDEGNCLNAGLRELLDTRCREGTRTS